MTEEEKLKLLEEQRSDPVMMKTIEAMKAYTQKFGSTFPIYGFPGKYEEIATCAMDCVEQGKDVYEMGYMMEREDLGWIDY